MGEEDDRDEMVRWHHQLNGCESEQIPGDGEGQGCLVCCSPRSCKELDTTEQLNSNNFNRSYMKVDGLSKYLITQI